VAVGGDLYLVCGPVPEPEDKKEFWVAADRVTALVQQELKAVGLAAEPTEPGSYVLRVRLNLEN
jgi:hypothetical protein